MPFHTDTRAYTYLDTHFQNLRRCDSHVWPRCEDIANPTVGSLTVGSYRPTPTHTDKDDIKAMKKGPCTP